jgi:hypothetical protein
MLMAVLDADVLFPVILRDTLLRAAAAGCFRLSRPHSQRSGLPTFVSSQHDTHVTITAFFGG